MAGIYCENHLKGTKTLCAKYII